MCFSCSCLKMNIASEHPLFFRNPNWFSLSCGSTIYLIIFSSILANTLLGCVAYTPILRALSSVSFPFPYRYYYGLSPLHRCYSIFPDCFAYYPQQFCARLLLLLLSSQCLFRLFRVPSRSLLISVTPRLLIVVFLARAP